ncbi:MAG: STAS domain-containing protein [Treponema sp.]|nr:STAS domain-containing protein [Treponema sp.]
MKIEKTIGADAVILALSGELTAVTADKLEAAIEETRGEAKKLILDFKELEYTSSAGLRVILSSRKKLGGEGLVLRGVSEKVMQVFEITGLDEVLTFE